MVNNIDLIHGIYIPYLNSIYKFRFSPRSDESYWKRYKDYLDIWVERTIWGQMTTMILARAAVVLFDKSAVNNLN